MSSETPGYGPAVSAFLERRLLNRVETPEALLEDVATALARNHGMAAYEYEERFVTIHHPTRLCPDCHDVVRMEVVVNRDTDERTRCCPDCSVLECDSHVDPELHEIFMDLRGGFRV